MTELSSLTASVTMREFGFFFFFRIAVDVSSSVFFSAPEASLLHLLATGSDKLLGGDNLLEINLGLLRSVIWFSRHVGNVCVMFLYDTRSVELT